MPHTEPSPHAFNPAPVPPYYGAPAYPQGVAAQPPALTATILITFFFGLFGLIPAFRGARRARNVGRPENRYWVAFGVTFAGSIALYVVLVIVALTALVGVAVRSQSSDSALAGWPATTAAPAQSSEDTVRARVAAIMAAHGPAVAVLGAVDRVTAQALTVNPGDISALATALREVAKEQGAGDAEAQAVSQAVITRAPELAAVDAIPPDTLATLQADPTDPEAGAAAVGAIEQKLGVSQAQAVQLLTSLGTPEVQSDMALVSKYGTVLKSAQAEVPAADLAYLQAHAGEVASSPTK